MGGLVQANSQAMKRFGSGVVTSAVTGKPHMKTHESLPCSQRVTCRRQRALSSATLPEEDRAEPACSTLEIC